MKLEINQPHLMSEFQCIRLGFSNGVKNALYFDDTILFKNLLDRAKRLGHLMKIGNCKKARYFNPYYLNKAWEDGWDNGYYQEDDPINDWLEEGF